MTPQESIPDIKSNTEITNGFQHSVDKFLLSFPCIICKNDIVYTQEIYDLLDFRDNGEIVTTKVKFFDAYMTGYKVTIVILNTNTGELLKRSHRLNNDSLPCNWILTDYFKPKNKEDELLEFDF